MSRTFLFLSLLFCLIAFAESSTPNFIVINIDDLGYGDIGPFGSTLNRTPNLDRMAAEGMKLKCHYAAPVCSPSRASLMTGCYPKRVLPIPTVLFPSAAVGLNPQEETVAEVLKSAGYSTMCIGKWHLGDQPEFLPTKQGFDHYFGLPYSNDMGLASEGSKSNLGDPLPKTLPGAEPSGPVLETGLGGNHQPPLPLVRDDKVVERVKAAEQQTLTQRYSEEAVKFIRDHKDQRFFLYLPPSAVHFPLYPGKAFVDKSKNGLYGDWVEEVDWLVGQVLNTLRELKLDGNTLVLFTSDNGGTPRAINAPLRGFKTTTWEGGMRVPTIAWWPGKIAPGTATDEITSMMDVLPTFADLAGAALPKQKIDGLSLKALLAGKGEVKGPHDVFYFYRGLKLEAIRSGEWKLRIAGGDAPKNPGPKKQKQTPAEKFPQLYHLTTDIGESKNVADENPDVVAKLRSLADQMKNDLGLDGVGPGCRAMGHVENPRPLMTADGTIREGFQP